MDDDAWRLPDRSSARREPLLIGNMPVTQRALAIAGILVLVLFIAILAAAGVFSSGTPTTTPTIPTTPVTVTAPASTTPLTTSPAANVTPPSTSLKPNDTGSEVTALQNELNALGFSVGKADGFYGPATQAAVKNFQTSKGLTADGIVGPQTLNALQQAVHG